MPDADTVPSGWHSNQLRNFSKYKHGKHCVRRTLTVLLKLCPALVCLSLISMCLHHDVVGLKHVLNGGSRLLPQPCVMLL